MANKLDLPDAVLNMVLTDIIKYACTNVADPAQIDALCRQNDVNGKWLMDSLSSQQALSHIASFFGLKDENELAALLASANLEKIRDAVKRQLLAPNVNITFYTSGTTGKPKAIKHNLEDLLAEASHWSSLFHKNDAILSCVPLNHIYGFIWAALMSVNLHASVTDIRKKLMVGLQVEQPSLLIAIPSMHELLMMMPEESKRNCTLILSTEPCAHETIVELKQSGFKDVIQIYGSTETGGIGWRNAERKAYRLRDDFSMNEGHVFNTSGNKLPLQDSLTFEDGVMFNVGKRNDNSIQVSGYNVSSAYVEQKLMSLPNISSAKVEVKIENGRDVLTAKVVTKYSESLQDVLDGFDTELKRALPPQHVQIN